MVAPAVTRSPRRVHAATAPTVSTAELARTIQQAVEHLWPEVRRRVPGLGKSKAKWSRRDEVIIVTGARLGDTDVNVPEELAEALLAPYLGEVTVHIRWRRRRT